MAFSMLENGILTPLDSGSTQNSCQRESRFSYKPSQGSWAVILLRKVFGPLGALLAQQSAERFDDWFDLELPRYSGALVRGDSIDRLHVLRELDPLVVHERPRVEVRAGYDPVYAAPLHAHVAAVVDREARRLA
jgi:hypothetical protein